MFNVKPTVALVHRVCFTAGLLLFECPLIVALQYCFIDVWLFYSPDIVLVSELYTFFIPVLALKCFCIWLFWYFSHYRDKIEKERVSNYSWMSDKPFSHLALTYVKEDLSICICVYCLFTSNLPCEMFARAHFVKYVCVCLRELLMWFHRV